MSWCYSLNLGLEHWRPPWGRKWGSKMKHWSSKPSIRDEQSFPLDLDWGAYVPTMPNGQIIARSNDSLIGWACWVVLRGLEFESCMKHVMVCWLCICLVIGWLKVWSFEYVFLPFVECCGDFDLLNMFSCILLSDWWHKLVNCYYVMMYWMNHFMKKLDGSIRVWEWIGNVIDYTRL